MPRDPAVRYWTIGLCALALAAPFFLYPLFLMRALCLALFACAFNLLVGYVGLLSFGHAAFFGGAAYITAYAVKAWGLCRRNSAFSPGSRPRRRWGPSLAGWRSAARASISR